MRWIPAGLDPVALPRLRNDPHRVWSGEPEGEGRYRGLPSNWAVLDRPALETDPLILDRQVFAER